MKLLYFGSFSPVHYGHLQQIKSCEERGYDVEVVISPHNPDKDINILLPLKLRVKMLETSIEELGLKAEVNLIEKDLPKPNYTYKTLRKLKEKYGDIAILAGTDVLNNIHNWKNYSEIRQYKFVELLREGYIKEDTDINIIDQIEGIIPMSSTDIRTYMKNKQYDKVKECMPDKVFKIYLDGRV